MLAWEITIEDIALVTDAHELELTEEVLDEIHSKLDHDSIIQGLLYFCDMEVQTASMLEDIEKQLIEIGNLVTSNKKFAMENNGE